MKILISADMEGVTGVVTWEHVTPGSPEYQRFCRLMTSDVNAAVRGALAGGAQEVCVTDGHWNGSNILIEELDPRVRLNCGSPSAFSMMQGIDEAVDGVMFVGYHARHGTPKAVLDHTWSSSCVHGVWLNDAPAGEYTLNAALAGHFDIPLLLITGDLAACSQVSELIESVETVVVKTASGRFAADCLPPTVTGPLIEAAARHAVRRLGAQTAPSPYQLHRPVQLAVEFQSSDMADRASVLQGMSRDGCRLSASFPDMIAAYGTFRAMVSLAHPA
jgi:D-amino peptidase